MNYMKTLNKVTRNTIALVLFLLSPNTYAQYDFSDFYQFESNIGGVKLDSLSNMLLLNDEFEQSYLVFPKKDFLDSINASKQLKWFTMTFMSRESKGYALILTLQLALAPNSDFVEEDEEFIVIVDEDRPRMKYNLQIAKNDSALIAIRTTDINEWGKIANSNSSKFRINGEVYEIDSDAKVMMQDVHSVVNQLIEKEFPSLKPEQSEEVSGFSPYEIQWEGDIERIPLIQPLPNNVADIEAVITVRIEIRPNGTVGRIIPLRKMSPDLETEILRTLRSWRFNRLPTGVPEQAQWSTITFRFTKEKSSKIELDDKPEDDFFVVAEKMPQLKGGLSKLQKQVRYPVEARKMGIEGRVTVQFIVGVDGSVENPRVIRGIGGGCDEEALRVIKTATFTPGKQRGRPVRVQYSLPIVFRL